MSWMENYIDFDATGDFHPWNRMKFPDLSILAYEQIGQLFEDEEVSSRDILTVLREVVTDRQTVQLSDDQMIEVVRRCAHLAMTRLTHTAAEAAAYETRAGKGGLAAYLEMKKDINKSVRCATGVAQQIQWDQDFSRMTGDANAARFMGDHFQLGPVEAAAGYYEYLVFVEFPMTHPRHDNYRPDFPAIAYTSDEVLQMYQQQPPATDVRRTAWMNRFRLVHGADWQDDRIEVFGRMFNYGHWDVLETLLRYGNRN